MGRLEGLLLQKTGDEMRVRFIGVLLEQARELLFARARDQLRRGLTAQRIHPHVERTDPFVAEAAIGIVELHRRHAEVRQNQVDACQPLGGQHLRQAREVRVARDEHVGAEAGRAQTRFRARQLERVDIEPDEAAARPHTLQDRSRMTAPAERAIHRDLAGARSKAAQDFVHHDRQMHARRRPAGREDLLHVRGVPLGVQLLVFVVKRARVLARVAPASRVHGGTSGGLSGTPYSIRARYMRLMGGGTDRLEQSRRARVGSPVSATHSPRLSIATIVAHH